MIRYGPFLEELQNTSYAGRYEYPNPQSGTFDPLIRRSVKIQGISGQGGRGRGGRLCCGMSQVRFTQQGQFSVELVPGWDGATTQCTCYNCSKSGNISFNFTETGSCRGGCGISATSLLKNRIGFKKSKSPDTIPINWILLYTCYTARVVNNSDMTRAVHD